MPSDRPATPAGRHDDPVPGPVCAECGRPLDLHDRHYRFRLPDALVGADGAHIWCSHEDPAASVLLRASRVGAFVRCLLPVQLTGGFTVTFGIWLAVRRRDLRRAHRVWWSPDYPALVLDGRLANALPVWGLLAVPARARVRDPGETPYVVESTHPELTRVLSEQWPHEDLLAALPPP